MKGKYISLLTSKLINKSDVSYHPLICFKLTQASTKHSLHMQWWHP